MPATKTRQSLVPRNMPRLRLSLMMPLSHHSLCNGPQPAWNPAGRAFRVAVQSFFRSPFPQARTLGKRREAWDTRRLCALRTVSMLKPKSQRKYNVEQLDHNDQQRPPPPFDTVYHGNCIDIMAAMPPESVDFILTDPPYITRYQGRDGRTVANDDNAAWLEPAFARMHRVLKPDSFCVSFYGWPKAGLFLSAWRRTGFRLAGHIVFRKAYASNTGFLQYRHEQAYLLAKGNPPRPAEPPPDVMDLSLIHISEPTRLGMISYAVFCL